MSKEECQKALNYLFDNSLIDDYSNNIDNKMYDILQKTIEEHFELLDGIERIIDKAKELSDLNDELERTIHSLDCELSDVYNPKPYKFEDLKPNMWVYDIKYDEFCRIDFIAGIYPHRSYSDGTCEDGAFEENRFFPVQYANLIKMGVKEDG